MCSVFVFFIARRHLNQLHLFSEWVGNTLFYLELIATLKKTDRARDKLGPIREKMFIKRVCYARGLEALNLITMLLRGAVATN